VLNSEGRVPVSRLSPRSNPVRLVRAPNSVGKVPVSWLRLKCICFRLVRAASSQGMLPVSWFTGRDMCMRLVRVPSSEGRVPVSWLVCIHISVRLVRVPSSVGRVPVSELLPRSKRVHDAGAAIHLWYAEVSLILPAEVLTTKSNITIIGAAIVLRVLMEQPGLSCILNKLSERGSVRLG